LKEIETRIIDIDVEEIRRKLFNINALKVKQENQINNIYDFADKRLIKNKGALAGSIIPVHPRVPRCVV